MQSSESQHGKCMVLDHDSPSSENKKIKIIKCARNAMRLQMIASAIV